MSKSLIIGNTELGNPTPEAQRVVMKNFMINVEQKCIQTFITNMRPSCVMFLKSIKQTNRLEIL